MKKGRESVCAHLLRAVLGRPGIAAIALFLTASLHVDSPVWGADRFQRARDQLVRENIVSAGIQHPGVIESIRTTPRHEFMSPTRRHLAYFDMAVPIGHGQTISPPYIVAFMTEQLDPQPTDRVLEIGTGSGYQAAVLSPLVREVYTIEIVEPLGQQADRTLKRLGYRNVFTRIGDGFQGWPEHAPFNKIIVTCSPESIPQPLIDQLAEGGQMIIPVGERFQQTLCRFRKVGDQLEREQLQATFFVPMTGRSEDERQVKPDNSQPHVVHGGFEAKLGETEEPIGWYYVRQARVTPLAGAPEGEHCVVFANRDGGRSAHALQAFGIDGEEVREIDVSLWVKANGIRPGRQQDHRARVILELYGENRAPVAHFHLGPWSGSFEWQRQSRTIRIPPTARLGVIGVGLFGATGELSIDDVVIDARAPR